MGCAIENNSDPESVLRDVMTFNPSIISDLPHYHLSIACNHCMEPPCVQQCPAKAIRKDTENGIVIINEAICIGCNYCSWTCPFGAPVFDVKEGIMNKCDLCYERIGVGSRPACETVCPTGALQTQVFDPELSEQNVPFFPESGFYPAISIEKPERPSSLKQQYINTYPEEVLGNYSRGTVGKNVDISLKREWTLLLFTLLISVLGAVFGSFFLTGMNVDPVIFGVSGISGIFISVIHLGKKIRVFRIIRNFLNSWLSREALFFSLFLFSSILSLSGKFNPVSGITGLITIYLTAFSADMIYVRSARIRNELFHSAQVTITLSLLLSFMTGFAEAFVLFAIIKIYLYLRRKVEYGFGSTVQILLIVSRLVPGLIIPSAVFLIAGVWGIVPGILLFTGEVLDRCEFYYELEILTPRYAMESHFKKKLSGEG